MLWVRESYPLFSSTELNWLTVQHYVLAPKNRVVVGSINIVMILANLCSCKLEELSYGIDSDVGINSARQIEMFILSRDS